MDIETTVDKAGELARQGAILKGIDLLAEACRIHTQNGEARLELALMLASAGRVDDALSQLSALYKLDPARQLLTSRLHSMLSAHERSAGSDKSPPDWLSLFDPCGAFFCIGIACARLGLLEDARHALELVINRQSRHVPALVGLGRVCMRLQDHARAEACFKHALELAPNLAAAHTGYGNSLLRQGRYDDAAAVFSNTAGKFPRDVGTLNRIGNIYRTTHMLSEAMRYYQLALKQQPSCAEIWNNVANIHLARGQITEACDGYQKATALKPDFWQAGSNRVMAMNYLPDTPPASLLRAHQRWSIQHTSHLNRFHDWPNRLSPGRPLRVGYVSPDFHHHPVAAFMAPILSNHDERRIVPVCFSDSLKIDEVTLRLQGYATRWHTVAELDDDELTALVRREAIDILVDLAGHTGKHRLRVFARKPAPIQISYLGYPATTGLTEIDYRLSDHWADPPGDADGHCTETLLRLPSGFLCYQPDSAAPEVRPPPSDGTGRITFGSLNNLSKVNDEVVSCWSDILLALPESRLLIKNLALGDPSVRECYWEKFESNGVQRERVELRSRVASYAEHLATYHEIDIALDTFPYNGTTTTCEALWMGVPVVTLSGRLHAGRVGHSLLARIQLGELVAADIGQYKKTALSLAGDPARLRELRQSLRRRMACSSLCDGPGFTRELEDIYRAVWTDWCERAAKLPSSAR